MNNQYDILICGGGTGGITVAAQLAIADPELKIAIIEPSDKHYYQPLWTLVGGGVFPKEESQRNEEDFIPYGVDWIRQSVATFDPQHNSVTLDSGEQVSYGYLIVALGIQINWDGIPGLKDSVGKPGSGVCSNYSYETATSSWDNIRSFRGGHAIFTQPDTPIKCGGAPQKIMYLAEDYFRKTGIRNQCKVSFCKPGSGIFSVPKYAKTLNKIAKDRDINHLFEHVLKEIRVDSREAVFRVGENDEAVLKYDMLHVTPPMGPMDVLKECPLADGGGWIDVDKYTLQHVQFDNVFSLGDCSNLPTAKTGAAIRKEAPVLVSNLLAHRSGQPLNAKYDGYSSCPLVTGYGRLILAEFDYNNEPMESFPFDQSQERYSMYALKAYGLPRMYWHGMLRGRM